MEDAHYEPNRRSTRRSRRRHARNHRRSATGGSNSRPGTSDLQQAVDRFEQAVQDLVGSATSELGDRATTFLNETTAKLEQELGGGRRNGAYEDSDSAARMRARRRARDRARSERLLERSPRLCRDDEHAKIVGVCAGIANYYGVEAWIVRCIAVTGLLFFGSIVFPAYWIMYFVMDDPKTEEKPSKKRRERKRAQTGKQPLEVPLMEEPDRELSPRRNLRNVQADLQEVELRLRRMETHVTSGQYELQRELHKIDTERPEPRLAASNPEPGQGPK